MATDMVIVETQQTAQAGLSLLSSRVSAANTLQLAYINTTAGALTPTAGAWIVYSFPSQFQLSAALTPAAVPANTTVEQQFSVPGLVAGQFVQVNKPSTNAGLGVATARVVSNNVIGITYVNATATPITPTAGETYSILGTGSISMRSNILVLQSNIGTPVAVAANTTAAQTLTFGGLQASDLLLGISKPTAQAGLGISGQFVVSAGNMSVTFVNATAGSLTPTPNEIYSIIVYRRTPLPLVFVGTQLLTPTSVAANTTAAQTFTLTGANAILTGNQTAAAVNKPTLQAGLSIGNVRTTAANTIEITFVNNTAAAIVPNSEIYTIALMPTVVGNANASSEFPADVVFQKVANQMTGIASGLGPTGLNLIGAS